MCPFRLSPSGLVGFLLASALTWVGCGTNTSITGPDPRPDAEVSFQDTPSAAGKHATYPWYAVASAKVNPGEAQTTVQGSRYTLTFSKGAVSRATTVTILERDPDVIDVQLFPDGTTFEAPVTLTIDYSWTANDPRSPDYHWGAVQVARFDDGLGTWTLLEGTDDPDTRTYTVELTGFSRYALGSGVGGHRQPTTKDIPPPAQVD